MTATFTAERRRAQPTPPRPLRELPVLFHLMDVSRPKGFAAPPPPAFTLGSVAREPELPRSPYSSSLASELVSQPPVGASEAYDLETAAELVQTKAYGSLPVEAFSASSPSLAPVEPATPEVNSIDSVAGESIPDTSLETPPPTGDDAVNLRQRAEQRERKRQESKSNDWFSTQGKYIAIGFVIALVVTIYVARSGHKPAAVPPVAAKPHAHPGDAASAKASPVKQAAAVESAKITSVRPTDKAVATSEPKTALHPPTIPQLADQPAGSSSPGDATLFTFSKRAEDRLATRTDAPATPGTGATAAAPESAAAPNATPAPTLQPQYPSTNYPSTYQPAAPPPAYAPPPAAPAGPALNPAASTAPLYPTTNTASGYRYERTGSSVY